jgi:hypothetical protein
VKRTLIYSAIILCAAYHSHEIAKKNRAEILSHLSPAEQIQQLDAWSEAEENNDDGFQGYDL